MNNKKGLTKTTSAIFLATVLVLGTIVVSFPSFMAGAQAQPYYGMDDRYNSYEPTEYSPEYTDNNSYEPDYPSYTPDYKPQYPSYEKDNREKSKDSSSKSISINKLNCINNNVNINGNNTGDINVGNSGKSATGSGTDEGYLGLGSVGGNGEGYDNNGYNKQKDKGFSCIINNSNTNINIEAGNATDGHGNEPETTCEECFAQVLNITELNRLQVVLGTGINVTIVVGTPEIEINSLGELCDVLENLTGAQVVSVVNQILAAVGIILTPAEFLELVTCIGTALDITIPRILAASNTNTATSAFDINTAGGLVTSFSSPPTIAQGTEDLSALEKVAKLKQQWMELLP